MYTARRNWKVSWDYDKYWDCREALFDPKTCRLKFLYCKHYVSITNRRQSKMSNNTSWARSTI